MALVFTVGTPRDVFTLPHADAVRAVLERQFGPSMNLELAEEPWYSEEMAWSGWSQLQDRCVATLGEAAAPHFLSMEAWKGVYIPVDTVPGTISQIPGDDTPLDVASLPALVAELETLGPALGLATDTPALQVLLRHYIDDDDLCDADFDIQTFAQLLLAARIAAERHQPLWVVK